MRTCSSRGSSVRPLALFVLLAALGVAIPIAHGRTNYPLQSASLNSSINVVDNSQAVVDSWIVDNVEHLNQMSNFYRIGSSGPETSVHLLTFAGATSSGPSNVNLFYTHPQFDIELDFNIGGGPLGSGTSTMGETVYITNTSFSQSLTFHFFEYWDLDLTNFANDDFGTAINPTSLEQRDAQTLFTVGSTNYDHHEFGFPSTLNKLNDGGPTTLNDQAPFGTPLLPIGDQAFCLQWDFVGVGGPRPAILPRQTAIITKNSLIQNVPEPGAAMILISCGAALQLRRRRSTT